MEPSLQPGKEPAKIDSRQNQPVEILLIILACGVLPFLGLSIFPLHALPFSLADLVLGLWLCTWLLLRSHAWEYWNLPREARPQAMQAVCLPLAVLGLLAIAWASHALTGLLAPQSSAQLPPQGLAGANPLLVAANLLVWALFEEVLYRVILPSGLHEAGMSRPLAITISLILFAWAHQASGLGSMLQALLCGVLLTLAWERQKSLGFIALAHGFFNILVWLLGTPT